MLPPVAFYVVLASFSHADSVAEYSTVVLSVVGVAVVAVYKLFSADYFVSVVGGCGDDFEGGVVIVLDC